ncbi:MAG: hypothetical protein ACLTDR_14900 [Adlercreutzia equolifaciens]
MRAHVASPSYLAEAGGVPALSEVEVLCSPPARGCFGECAFLRAHFPPAARHGASSTSLAAPTEPRRDADSRVQGLHPSMRGDGQLPRAGLRQAAHARRLATRPPLLRGTEALPGDEGRSTATTRVF